MNKKIYFNNNYILLTDHSFQPSGNQLIVNADEIEVEILKKNIFDFIELKTDKNLVLTTHVIPALFEKIKQFFKHIEAAGGLIRQNNCYLFIYRLGKWDLPKGKIDKGENPQQAAIRECEEECAISGLTIENELPNTYHIYPYKGQYALKTTYWFLMSSTYNGLLQPQTEENIEKVEWLDKNAINNQVIKNTYPSVLDLISICINN